MRNWRQERRISFDQHAIERYLHCRIPNLLRLRKGYIPSKRDHESHIERTIGMRPFAGEAVQNSAEVGRLPVLLDETETVIPCIVAVVGGPAVDHNRQLGRMCHFHLPDEYVLLYLSWRVVVVVVEANLAPGNHFRIARELFEAGEIRLFRQLGFMRMYAYGCVDKIMLLGDLDGTIESPRPITSSDRKHVQNACPVRPRNRLFAIRVEPRAVKMAVGIDEHDLPCRSDTPCPPDPRFSRCADKSIRATRAMLLQSGAQRHIFQKPRQHGLPSLK